MQIVPAYKSCNLIFQVWNKFNLKDCKRLNLKSEMNIIYYNLRKKSIYADSQVRKIHREKKESNYFNSIILIIN